jgi:two-component system sensor histidine kinase HydH
VSTPALLVSTNRLRTVETVLGWMLHDIRNPVQTLTLLSALLADPEFGCDPGSLESLGAACERLRHEIALIDRLVGSPLEPATPSPVVLADSLGFLVELFRARRGEFRLDLSSLVTSTIPAVAGRASDVEMALLELVLNAAEAECGRLGVRSVVRSDALDLILEDDGPGVPEALRGRLFEPFVTSRADRPDRGLGLYAARHLLEASGGSLDYEAGEAGWHFVVRLPLWRAPTGV